MIGRSSAFQFGGFPHTHTHCLGASGRCMCRIEPCLRVLHACRFVALPIDMCRDARFLGQPAISLLAKCCSCAATLRLWTRCCAVRLSTLDMLLCVTTLDVFLCVREAVNRQRVVLAVVSTLVVIAAFSDHLVRRILQTFAMSGRRAAGTAESEDNWDDFQYEIGNAMQPPKVFPPPANEHESKHGILMATSAL